MPSQFHADQTNAEKAKAEFREQQKRRHERKRLLRDRLERKELAPQEYDRLYLAADRESEPTESAHPADNEIDKTVPHEPGSDEQEAD